MGIVGAGVEMGDKGLPATSGCKAKATPSSTQLDRSIGRFGSDGFSAAIDGAPPFVGVIDGPLTLCIILWLLGRRCRSALME